MVTANVHINTSSRRCSWNAECHGYWNWLLENMALILKSNHSSSILQWQYCSFTHFDRLCAMDGRVLPNVDCLEYRGAYVIIPFGENFRDNYWYYLPDGSLDTSKHARLQRRHEQSLDEFQLPQPVLPEHIRQSSHISTTPDKMLKYVFIILNDHYSVAFYLKSKIIIIQILT